MAQNLAPLKEQPKVRPIYSPTDDERKVYDEYLRRKKELLDSRKDVHGINLDDKMRTWDKNYFNREADIPASELDPDQKPLAINNAFGKVQAALSILLDRNPKLILKEKLKKYSACRELIKSLAEVSWDNTNSLGQFKLSVFNAAKRGWFAGRTFNRVLKHKARFAKSIDEKGKVIFEEREVTKLDDVAYMNLDNHNAWIDEQAKPEDMWSIRDWCWRELWFIDDLKAAFPESEYPNMKYVVEGGNTQERVEGDSQSVSDSTVSQSRELKKGMTEVFFYENQYTDWFIMEINKVMVIWEPMPQEHKRISLVTAPWNLRSAETIYGIGIIEEMERDETLADRIVNMTMRQLLISINPPGFYNGPEDFEDENIKIKPGKFIKTLNPKDITFLQVPPPRVKENLEVIGWLEQKEEQKTGITKHLEGEEQQNNNTAFEIGVRREASLKRLRLPLKSFQYALAWEFKNRIDLIRQVYSEFQVEHLVDEEEIMAYLEEVQADPDFYFIENEGQAGQEKFYVKKFREVNIGLEKDEKGVFTESDNSNFFKVKPEYLVWEGDAIIDINSILVQSDEMEKADTLRFTNLLVPMFQMLPEIALKPAKQLCMAFNRDPKKWLPQAWLDMLEKKPQENEMQMPQNVQDMMSRNQIMQKEQMNPQNMQAETIIPQRELEKNPGMIDRLKSAYQAFRQ